MLSFTVKISGDKDELARIQKLGNKLVDFSSVLKSLGAELKTYYSKTVFGTEGGALGKKWQALSPVYKKWKGKHFPNKGMLIASGTMQKSFRAVSTATKLTIDNTDPKFKWHQNGTGYGGASLIAVARGKSLFGLGGVGPGRGHNLPARPMLAITPEVINMLGSEIKNDVESKIRSLT